MDFAPGRGDQETPLCSMSLYDYAMFVRIVDGDPWDLKANQYAFEEHHAKFDTFVQELRPSPVPLFIHGFTMPTAERDAETNALFKQLLLRPHCCAGPGHCLEYNATRTFCDGALKRCKVLDADGVPQKDSEGRVIFEHRCKYSFVRQWRMFEAQQMAAATRADAKIQASRRYPVLQDTTAVRSWWLPDTHPGGVVHTKILPALRAVRASARVPLQVSWLILRLAGDIRDDDGSKVFIANTPSELERAKALAGNTGGASFTSQGFHDEQLTPDEFFAWRRCECAARLDYMAEARHRPRPGNAHPEALVDDPDGVHGGNAPDGAEFEHEDGLPGGSDDEEATETKVLMDPELAYKPKNPLPAEDLFDTLHRHNQLQKQVRDRRAYNHEVLKKFNRDHVQAYDKVRTAVSLVPSGGSVEATPEASRARKAALNSQQLYMETAGREADETARLRRFATARGHDAVEVARALVRSLVVPQRMSLSKTKCLIQDKRFIHYDDVLGDLQVYMNFIHSGVGYEIRIRFQST